MPGGGEHGLAHAGVGAATAEVAGEAVLDVLECGRGGVVEQGLGGHHEAGRAEAALLGVVLDERHGERMEISGPRETFDRLDRLALDVDRELAARVDCLAVENDRAGPAGAAVADPLGAGELELLAQDVEQRGTRLDIEVVPLVVDPQPDGHGPRTEDLHALRDRPRPLLRRLGDLRDEHPGRAERAGRGAAAQELAAGDAAGWGIVAHVFRHAAPLLKWTLKVHQKPTPWPPGERKRGRAPWRPGTRAPSSPSGTVFDSVVKEPTHFPTGKPTPRHPTRSPRRKSPFPAPKSPFRTRK